MKFRHFVAQADLGDLNVAVYGDDDSNIRVLKVHHAGTQKEWGSRRISKTDYVSLRDAWGLGLTSPDTDAVMTQRALEWMDAKPTNHPNRRVRTAASTPSAVEIKQTRAQAGLTQTQAAALVHTTCRVWQQYEHDDRRMHPAFWELFCIKTGLAHTEQPHHSL